MKALITMILIVSSPYIYGQELTINDLIEISRNRDLESLNRYILNLNYTLLSIDRKNTLHTYVHEKTYSPSTNAHVLTSDTLRFSENSEKTTALFITGNAFKLIPLLPEMDSLGFIPNETIRRNETVTKVYHSSNFPSIVLHFTMSVAYQGDKQWEVAELKVEKYIQ